jgi:integrase
MSGEVSGRVILDPFELERAVKFGVVSSLKGVSDSDRSLLAISKNSFFPDVVWDLSDEHPELHPVNVKLNFSSLTFDDGTPVTSPNNHRYLRSLMEYAYSFLIDPPSSQPKWSTFCYSYRKGVKYLVNFMFNQGIQSFSELTATDLSKFLGELASIPLAGDGKITNRTLRTRAYGLHWLYEQSFKLEDGLVCDPFVEYGSLTQWARHCCEKNIPRQANSTVEIPDVVAKELLVRAIEDLKLADTLEDLRAERAIYVPIRVQAKGKLKIVNPFPWYKYGLTSGLHVRGLEARLAAASYIVIAMLTGMRWHEIVAIKSGASNHWIEETVEHEGLRRKFCFVITSTNKLQANPTEYRWQTIPIVKDALDAVDRGFANRRKDGIFLFSSDRALRQRVSRSSAHTMLISFVAFHNVLFGGELWPLATHQFRKKFARIMVRQGLGLRILQDQLKHFDIEMTRGYGDMNLYVELQREKFQLSTEQYDELLSNQVPIIGGGAAEVKEYRKQFLGMTKLEQIKFLQELPKSALIEQLDDGLCMYRSHKALCGGDRAACRPADCNNSVLLAAGKRKTFEWRRQENLRLLEYFKTEPLKASFLIERIAELDKLLRQLDGTERGVSP